jgi:hypothetical protein
MVRHIFVCCPQGWNALSGGFRIGRCGQLCRMPGKADSTLTWIGVGAILLGAVALRFTDRLWLVDSLEALGLGETGDFWVGLLVGIAWYTFPLVIWLTDRLSHRGTRRGKGTVRLWIFVALGAAVIVALPNRYDSAYNDALDNRTPGFQLGLIIGCVPFMLFGLALLVVMRVLDRRRPSA